MEKSLTELAQIVVLAETRQTPLVLAKLAYDRNDLDPVMSKALVDYHYGTLAKGYVTRYNAGQGDADFNRAGAFLHNIFFPQLKSPSGANKPHGASQELINQHYSGGLTELKEQIAAEAMKLQGSGWIYLARDGSIKTIKNHAIKNDIILLIDLWEHSYNLDYLADKAAYLKNMWRIIDWSVINDRINSKTK